MPWRRPPPAGARRTVAGADFLCRAVAEDMAERLAAVKRRFAARAPRSAARFPCSPPPARSTASSGSTASPRPGPTWSATPSCCPSRRKASTSPSPSSRCTAANDLPGALAQMRRALKPDGLFLAAFLGGDTLDRAAPGLRHGRSGDDRRRLAARGALHRRQDRRRPHAARRLRPAGGRSGPPHRALRLGAPPDARPARHGRRPTCCVERERRPLRRAVLMRAVEIYGERFADADGRVRATFDVISLSGWAPHESQQQAAEAGQRQACALPMRSARSNSRPARRREARVLAGEARPESRSANRNVSAEADPPPQDDVGASGRAFPACGAGLADMSRTPAGSSRSRPDRPARPCRSPWPDRAPADRRAGSPRRRSARSRSARRRPA